MLLSKFCQGYYDSSDDGVMDDDGFVSIMARTDDVINVAGHRISTKALEEVKMFRQIFSKKNNFLLIITYPSVSLPKLVRAV